MDTKEELATLLEETKDYKILFIEDNKQIQESTTELLHNIFGKVVVASDGIEGLELYKKTNDFDIVLTDIMMPRLNGLDMSKELRKINPNQNIIILSAYSETKYMVEAIDINVDGFLLKPISLTNLINTCQKIVNLKNLKAEKELLVQSLDIKVKKLELSNRKLQAMMDKSKQGFLYFNKELIIKDEHSHKVDLLFGNIVGERFDKLIYISVEKQKEFADIVEKVFHEDDDFKQEMYLELLNTKIEYKETLLELEFQLIESDSIMVIITDLKHEVELINQHDKYEFALHVFKNKKELLSSLDLVDEFRSSIKPTILDDATLANTEKVYQILQNIHTFKGIFKQLKFINTPTALHQLESEIKELDEDKYETFLIDIRSKDYIFEFINKDLNILTEILGEDFIKVINILESNSESWVTIKDLAKKITTQNSTSITPDVSNLLTQINNLNQINIKEFISRYKYHVQNLSSQIGKKCVLIVEGDDIFVDKTKYNSFGQSLVHIINNAIIHGIETPDERFFSGKQNEGTITCSVKNCEDNLEIIIEDDGAGIDIDKIHATIAPENNNNNQAIIENIFVDGFTTHSSNEEFAGRGVGLSAVKHQVESLGGTIKVESQKEKFTKFTIVIEKI